MNSDSTSPPAAASLALGGGFVLVRRLRGDDRDGCGLAETPAGGRFFARWSVALRAPDRAAEDEEERSSPAEVEYRVLTTLSTVGVPVAVDLHRDSTRHVSVSSWIDAAPMSDAGRLDDVRLESVARQLAAILSRAHRCGWIHGDIKPANVLLGADGNAHLIDWAGARKIGKRAHPGTLGYAPPWTWSANHLAEARDDYYSLAMTLWELRHGRPAFDGDRAQVLQQQAAFSFGGDVPPTVAQLFACAEAGTDFAFSERSDGQTPGSGIRPAAAEMRLVRRSILAPARSAAASLASHLGSTIDLPLPVDPRDVDCAADALVAELRLAHGVNALRWRELVARLASQQTDEAQDASVSRVDLLRDRCTQIESEARSLLATLTDAVLVIAPDEVAPTEMPAWKQLRDVGASAENAVSAAFTVVTATATTNPSFPAPDRSRDVLEEIFDGAAIGDGLAALAGTRWDGSIRACVQRHYSAVASANVAMRLGVLDAVGGPATSTTPASAGSTESDSEADSTTGAIDSRTIQQSIENWLQRGETSALQGNSNDTVAVCIRAHACLSVMQSPAIDHLLRLADIWSEIGRSDAAEVILNASRHCADSVDAKLRVARLVSLRNDFRRLDAVLATIPSSGLKGTRATEFERLRAIVLMLSKDFGGAHLILKSAIKRYGAGRSRARLWLFVTQANVLRLRGQIHSAQRVLRFVQSQTSAVGGARLRIAVASNLLIAQAGNVPPAQLASEAWATARRCIALGMIREALINVQTAATYWIAVGATQEARQVIDAALREEGISHPHVSGIVAILGRIRLAAIDRDEAWAYVREELITGHERGVPPRQRFQINLLRDEFGIPAIGDGLWRRSARVMFRDERVVSDLGRMVSTARFNGRRTTNLLRQLEMIVDGSLPMLGHAARSIVRRSTSNERLQALLGLSRHDVITRETRLRLSLALHAAALGWRSAVDSSATQWFAENAPTDERHRPPGIRLWEWRLAIRRAAVETGASDGDENDVEPILETMEAAVNGVWPSVKAVYARSLPLRNVARFGGCELSDDEALADTVGPGSAFDRIRAALYRRRVTSGRGGKRAAGLERVLKSALRLRGANDVDSLLDEIVAGVAAVCRAERAVVVYDGGGRQARAKVASSGAVCSIPQGEAEVSQTAVDRVRVTKRACLIDDACGDSRLGDRPSVMQYRPRSLIVAPLQTQGEFLGYIYVENRSAAKSFSGSDVELVEGFAAQAAFALENAQLVEELRTSCEELDRARTEAVRAESLRVVGRMASEVAHDFNNLLTAVLGETQLLMQAEDLRPHAESLGVIERAALDGAEVIRRMQATTRVKDPASFVQVSLKEVVRNVLDMTRWRATSERIDVRCEIEAPLNVRGIPSELREVVTNLVVNALDAMSGGGELRIIGARIDGDAVVDVEDSGVGMDSVTASKAFDPFFSTKGERGNGLGLSIAYGIMQRHGGDIQIASRLGAGTRMRLVVPLARELPVPPRESRRPHVIAAPSERVTCALVVDDEPAVARILSSMLRRSGLEVEVSIGGAAGLSRLSVPTADYDLVITDVNMPDVNGIDVAVAALKNRQPARVVLMSGSLSGREEATAQALGVQVLRKPFTVKDIDRLVLGDLS